VRTNEKLTWLLSGILAALVLNLVTLAGILFNGVRRPKQASAPPAPAPLPATAATAEPSPQAAERVAWHDAPLLAGVGGDGTEDVIGQFSTTGGNGLTSYFVGAFDGATLARLWRAGPIAVLEHSERPPILQLVGGRLFAAESNAIHVYDVTNGDEATTLHTSDRVTELCLVAPDRARLWARVADGKSVSIDPATGETRPQETPPPSCAAGKPAKLDAPPVSGFAAAKVWVDGDIAVAVGAKSPGTPIPTAMGFDPKSKKVRWQRWIANTEDPSTIVLGSGRILEFTDGHVFATYRVTSGGWRFTAINGKTGDRSWDVAVPDGNASAGTVTVGETRVCLAHAEWLDVYEKVTGQQVGTLGDRAR
jgi:hypothetical protein